LAGVLICNTTNPADAQAAYRRLTGGLRPLGGPLSLGTLRRNPHRNGFPAPTAPLDPEPEALTGGDELMKARSRGETLVFKTPWGASFEVTQDEWDAMQKWLSRSRGKRQNGDPE